MKTNKIWTWAVLLGIVASGSLYLTLFADSNPKDVPAALSNPQSSGADQTNKKKSGQAANGNPEEEKPSSGLSIGQGKRAISVAVNEVQGVSGLLSPGDHVDVIALVPPTQGNNTSSQIMLQNVKILAVGVVAATPEKDPKAPVYRTVTLEISATDGTTLALAGQKGAVQLMLRASDDAGVTGPAHTTLERLHKGEIAK